MSGSKSARRAWTSRRWSPALEALDRRELLASGGLTHSLGPYVGTSELGPKVSKSPKPVNPTAAVNQLLLTTLGTGIDLIQAHSQVSGSGSPRAVLKQSVANQSFVKSVLSNADVYTLFDSAALSSLIGSEQLSGQTSSASTTSGTTSTTSGTTSATTGTTSTTTGTTGTSTTATTQLIGFSIPTQATIQSIGTTTTGSSTSIVQVNPSGGSPGFFATVPTTNIRITSTGTPETGSVLIPSSEIPAGYPLPTATFLSIGTFSATYEATGPLLDQIFGAGALNSTPNAPNSVPGLRLAPALIRNSPFPTGSVGKTFAQELRLAVQRDVFTLNNAQSTAVTAGISQFASAVQAMNAAAQFTPTVPVAAPKPVSGQLSGTLELSLGAVRRLNNVASGISGLPLPSLGNFPGRLDVGYVVDQAGNYGIILTARGPLTNANGNLSPGEIAAGDVRVEVSSAKTIGALAGSSVVEGVQVGAGTSSDLEASVTSGGVRTFAVSTGNGYGLEYGTGIAYTTVIPLGNVYALIPSAPPS